MSRSSSKKIANTDTAVVMALAEPCCCEESLQALGCCPLRGPGMTAKGKAVVRTSRGAVLGSFLIVPGHFSHEGRSCLVPQGHKQLKSRYRSLA